jgi:ABC-type spermidine/putrescine transport system permease subunit I
VFRPRRLTWVHSPYAPGTRILLALPAFGWTVLFFLAPLAILTVYSFGQIDFVTLEIRFGWTLENYVRITDDLYLSTIMRSLFLSVATTVACVVIGFPVAYYISQQKSSFQRLLVLAIMVPFWTGFLVRTYALVNLLSNGGPVEDIAHALGLLDGALDLLYTPTSVGIGIIYGYLPLMILPIYVALERIDPALRDAAADLGASGSRIFRRIVIPLAKPGIIAGCIIVGIPATGEFVIPAILGGNKTLMYGNVVANQFLGVGDTPFGSALAVSLMGLLTVAILILRRRVTTAEDLS